VTPRRALIVSADIGEGHNSAGRALEEAIARMAGLPGALAGRPGRAGPRFAQLARGFYAGRGHHEIRHSQGRYRRMRRLMGGE
jgi:hypothetical protein